MKKLLIDYRIIEPFPTGLGSHFLNLTGNLIGRYRSSLSIVIVVTDRNKDYVKQELERISGTKFNRNIEVKVINIPVSSIMNYILFPYIFFIYRKINPDVILTDPWSVLLIMPKRYILMIYDLIGFNLKNDISLKQKIYDKFIYSWVAKRAYRIIASTVSGKNDINKFLHIKSEVIKVISPSISEDYKRELDSKFISDTLEKYRLNNKRYICYLGNRRPHKNMIFALNVLKELDENISLVVIGHVDVVGKRVGKSNNINLEDVINDTYIALKDRVILLGRIESNIEVKAILSKSICLVHPSKFEGFGLTPLEALSSGTPVITSNIQVLKEAIGKTQIVLNTNPDDIEKWVECIERYSFDAKYREEAVSRGRSEITKYSWSKSAKKLFYCISLGD